MHSIVNETASLGKNFSRDYSGTMYPGHHVPRVTGNTIVTRCLKSHAAKNAFVQTEMGGMHIGYKEWFRA